MNAASESEAEDDELNTPPSSSPTDALRIVDPLETGSCRLRPVDLTEPEEEEEGHAWGRRGLPFRVSPERGGRGGALPPPPMQGKEWRRRQVVVRAYLPGHEDCHNFRAPIGEYAKGVNGWYNWNLIGDFNRAFEVRLLPLPCLLAPAMLGR